MINFDPQFFSAVSFVVLVVLSYKKLKNIIGTSINKTQTNITQDVSNSTLILEEARHKLSEVQSKHAEITKKAEEIIQKAKLQAKNIVDTAEKEGLEYLTVTLEESHKKALVIENYSNIYVKDYLLSESKKISAKYFEVKGFGVINVEDYDLI